MKYLLCGLTSTDEIRRVLNECIDNSQYDHKTLASKLQLLFPLEGWSERSLNYMLSEEGSRDISICKANQIMDFLYPEETFEFSLDNFYEAIENMNERLALLRSELTKATRGDKVIDHREHNILKAHLNILNTLISKFEECAVKAVNVTLG